MTNKEKEKPAKSRLFCGFEYIRSTEAQAVEEETEVLVHGIVA